jgi:hypothetical protein
MNDFGTTRGKHPMTIKNALAGVAVADLDSAVRWYEKLLGRAPDARPMETLAEWRFATGGWLQVFQDGNRAGRSSVTFAESDLSGRLETLRDLGVKIGPTTDGDLVKTAIVNDLDGNQLVFAQGMDADHRSTR